MQNNFKNEVMLFLRNNDVMTITERGVTTITTSAIPLTGATSYLLNVPNVKNIRSIVVGSTTLKYGTEYFYDPEYLNTTIKCNITFTTAQTGNMVIIYDYGADKIWGDFPRDDLQIDSYPRIAIDVISKKTDSIDLGGLNFLSDSWLTCVIYSDNLDYIESHLNTIEKLMMTKGHSFYFIKFVKPIGQGPVIKSDNRNQTILHKNVDFMGQFELN